MSGFARFVVLVVAMASLVGTAASSAGAVTWDNLGNTAYTTTAPTMDFSATGVQLTCADALTTGTLPVGTIGTTLTMPLTTTAGCTLAGVGASLECRETFTATVLGNGGVTGNLDATCSVYQAGTTRCHIRSFLPATYRSAASSIPGKFIVTTDTGTQLAGGATCPLAGTGEPVHISETTRTVVTWSGGTANGGPRIVLTP